MQRRRLFRLTVSTVMGAAAAAAAAAGFSDTPTLWQTLCLSLTSLLVAGGTYLPLLRADADTSKKIERPSIVRPAEPETLAIADLLIAAAASYLSITTVSLQKKAFGDNL